MRLLINCLYLTLWFGCCKRNSDAWGPVDRRQGLWETSGRPESQTRSGVDNFWLLRTWTRFGMWVFQTYGIVY